jgi:hypothetical protein
MSVGVMEDYKLRDLRASHTLGASGMKHKELKAWGYWRFNCLLWIDEVRGKDKTYIWLSVWWFTDERLKTKTTEESTHLTYTELFGKLEHLKIETMLIEWVLLFIMNRWSVSQRQDLYMSVGEMKDQKLKLRNLRSSHTLGCSGNWNT